MPNQEFLQEIAENIDKYRIGLDDVFRFKCHGCGKCCKNRDDIILAPRDLFHIAKCLGMNTRKVIKMYCNTYIGENSRLPLVRLKTRGQHKICPLLKDKRCIVHAAKPTVCALYPLGRFVQLSSDQKADNSMEFEIEYMINPVECGGSRRNTVRGWTESFGISPDDPVYRLWTKTMVRFGQYVKDLEQNEPKIPAAGFDAIWSVAAEAFYFRYDTGKEFMPQFEANLAEMWRVLDELDAKVIQPFLNAVQPFWRGEVSGGI